MITTRATAAGLAVALFSTLVLVGCGGAEARRSTYMERGEKYFAAENFEKARVEFRNAMQVAPKDAEVRYMNGRVAERLGNARDALGLYQSAIEIDPEHVRARAGLGRLFVFGG